MSFQTTERGRALQEQLLAFMDEEYLR